MAIPHILLNSMSVINLRNKANLFDESFDQWCYVIHLSV